MPWGHALTAKVDGFNVFDSINRNYTAWGAGEVVGNPRSFQVGLKYDF